MPSKEGLTVQEVVERYRKNMAIWKVAARHDFEVMLESDDLNDIREEYYKGWTREHFAEVISEMKKHGG